MSQILSEDFLVELGTEELPPKALSKLSNAFSKNLSDSLSKAGLMFGNVECFATPRRLAVKISELQLQQEDRSSERKGPAVQAAYKDDGSPTPAALGFAKSCGVEISELETLETNKGAWLVFNSTVKGKETKTLLPEMIEHALAKLPIPKRMRWGSRNAQFVRPVHWLLVLLGKDVIPCNVLELKSDRLTKGHRFHCEEPLSINHPSAYEDMLLSKGKVIPNFSQRRSMIETQVNEIAASVNGTAIIDPSLLDEVTGLVEFPFAVLGEFDKSFLDIPSEALVSAMKSHQKYFHILKDDKLLPYFITVSNIESRNVETVKKGNERVIKPRLADAEFFWTTDRKTTLSSELDRLKNVIFQKQLGSVFEKTERVKHLSQYIAEQLSIDTTNVKKTAELAKCDLMSEMVGEFPELQGIMGRYYALHDGENEEVANGILEHYMPRFAGDELPGTSAGQCVSIADKLDTLVGIFSIGQSPTGDKDPFGLRRAALGIMRIMIEKSLTIDFPSLISHCAGAHKNCSADDEHNVIHFMMDRLKGYFLEKGIRPQVFDAVLATSPRTLVDFNDRVIAVTEFEKSEEASSLAAANKRIHNILKKIKGTKPTGIDTALFENEYETRLHQQFISMEKDVSEFTTNRQYDTALNSLAELKEPVDAFFENVMVMAEDESLKNNRLALLSKIYSQFSEIADFSRLS